MLAAKYPRVHSRSQQSPPAPEEAGYVCWSRMQAEAGQLLDAIIARKELERRAGDGLFLWGVGNAPSIAVRPLAVLKKPVRVIFSAMKTKPKLIDLTPKRTIVWRRYVDGNGIERPLPANALVTSRGDSAAGAKSRHYALMCLSETPLVLERGVPFDHLAYRNAGGAGAPVGASQVTALLRQVAEPASTASYEANIVAWLTDGYWVRLSDPRELGAKAIAELSGFDGDTDQWLDLVERLRGRKGSRSRPGKQDELLF